ncbi:MAG TPA: hypothetical protein O0X73_01895 [Methanocorpusculum sp.]|nr:hypothetical protein [Methanocorpusculum sp.]
MGKKITEIIETIEFIADIEGEKDCLMSQQGELWFNIDVPKGHNLKNGDKIRIIIERTGE